MNSLEQERTNQIRNLERITPALMRTDIDSLKELLAAYHNKLVKVIANTTMADEKVTDEITSQIRCSQKFVNWVENNISIINGG